MNVCDRVRAILMEGPATSVEIRPDVGVDCARHMKSLVGIGHLKIIGRIPASTGFPLNIYQLTPRGLHFMKRDKRICAWASNITGAS